MARLIGFAFGPWGPAALIAAGVAVVFGLWQADRYGQRQVGRVAERTAIERGTDAKASKGARAADKSLAGGVRKRDPLTRDE